MTTPSTNASRELLDHIERLDYDAYDAGREFMETRGGGNWAEALAVIEAEARATPTPCPQCIEIGTSGSVAAMMQHHNEAHGVPLPRPTLIGYRGNGCESCGPDCIEPCSDHHDEWDGTWGPLEYLRPFYRRP